MWLVLDACSGVDALSSLLCVVLVVPGKLWAEVHVAPSQNFYVDQKDASSTMQPSLKSWGELHLLFYFIACMCLCWQLFQGSPGESPRLWQVVIP